MDNELENYYSDLCRQKTHGISGKEEKPIYIVSQLVNDETSIVDLINCDEYFVFLNHVAAHE